MSNLNGRLKRLESRKPQPGGWDVDQWLERYYRMREAGQYPPDMPEETRARLREVNVTRHLPDGRNITKDYP